MTKQEREKMAQHYGHEIRIADAKTGEPITGDLVGRFTLECVDCNEIILGERILVGSCSAKSVRLK